MLGLFATEKIGPSSDNVLSVPYDDALVLSPRLATELFVKEGLPEEYDGWTGDRGLLAMLILNELALASSSLGDGGTTPVGVILPSRTGKNEEKGATELMKAWVGSLPSPPSFRYDDDEGNDDDSGDEDSKYPRQFHPLLWNEDDQEKLQTSCTRNIYDRLDDADEDSKWLEERLWSMNRLSFPEKVTLPIIPGDSGGSGGTKEVHCFTPEGFTWALALAATRSFYTDGELRIVPILDIVNHDDSNTVEVIGKSLGPFGTTKGCTLSTGKGRVYTKGEEIFASYGPGGHAEYLFDRGFIPDGLLPESSLASSSVSVGSIIGVSELTLEVSNDDRCRDDKLDVLEFETYNDDPMDPVQTFDLYSSGTGGGSGTPDPALLQFARFCALGGADLFMLEGIFREEVWGFMAEPVSRKNEADALGLMKKKCQEALEDMTAVVEGGADNDGGGLSQDASMPGGMCAVVRSSESQALRETQRWIELEEENLELKLYYQERRLKDLGLDSVWGDGSESSAGKSDLEYDNDDFKSTEGLDW